MVRSDVKKALRQLRGGWSVGGGRLESAPAVLAPPAIALFSALPSASPAGCPPRPALWPSGLARLEGWAEDSGLTRQPLPSPWPQGGYM